MARDASAGILPFAWMLQVPIEVWLGEHQGIDLLLVYAAQVGVARRRWSRSVASVLARAVRRVVVQGG